MLIILQNAVSPETGLNQKVQQQFTLPEKQYDSLSVRKYLVLSKNKNLRPSRLVFYDYITKFTDIFVEKLREAFALFSTKNIGKFQILTFEILMKC